MDVSISAQQAVFGSPTSERKVRGAIAVGFFLVTAFIAFVADSVYHTNPELLLSEEPLVESATFDDPVNPTELVVEFSAGLDAPGRMEITWWKRGAYRYHYTEPEGVDFRFDNHPKDGAPNAHFHPPPDAGNAEPSFLSGVTQPQIVTRAVITRWRQAVIEGHGLKTLNSNPEQ